jgi:pseudouridine kinase
LLALNKFHDKGIKNVIITCGEKGIYYSDSHSRGRIRSKKIKVVNANGAGDSFMAGLVYGFSNGMNIKEAAKYGYLSSIITLGSNMTISDNMSIDNLEKLNKENVLIMEEKVLI